MKNPCEECLVKSMCHNIICEELRNFMDFLIAKKIFRQKSFSTSDVSWIRIWMNKYERRTTVIKEAIRLGIIKNESM